MLRVPIYSRYIGGWDTRSLARTVEELTENGMRPIIDYVREASATEQKAAEYEMKVVATSNQTTRQLFALKLSGARSSERLCRMTQQLIRQGNDVTLDAENVATYSHVKEIANMLGCEYNTTNVRFYKTYQMYRRDAIAELKHDICHSYKAHAFLGIKLVRGAYHHQDVPSGQLFHNIHETHSSYKEGIRILLWNMARGARIVPIFATHNQESVAFAQTLAKSLDIANHKFAFAQLLGMNDPLSCALIRDGYKVYKYVPFGSIRESLPYLVRRLHENPDIWKYMWRVKKVN